MTGEIRRRIDSSTMLTFPLYILLMAASLPILVVMPQLLPPGDTGGETMTDGEQCQQLLQGLDPLLPDDLPWECVCMHCQSSQGPKGNMGDHGLPGSPGLPGIRGMTGYHGSPGYMGRPGIKGQKGDNGENGQYGQKGLVGPKGPGGFKGDTGDNGLDGYLGPQGPKGDDGVCSDTCESSFGPPGVRGLVGPVGPRGLPGITGQRGPKGNQGEKGNPGHLGTSGYGGEKGELGLLGECNCIDGLDGDPGQRGERGDKGNNGQKGPTGTGLPGVTGDQGESGIQGDPGLCTYRQSAFLAMTESSFIFSQGMPVHFSIVNIDILSDYNFNTGVYTAPINGTYVFKYELVVTQSLLKVCIVQNHINVIKTTITKVLEKSTHSVLLHLEQGDEVWIEVMDVQTNNVPPLPSSFSGFLLHPDLCDNENNGQDTYSYGNYLDLLGYQY